MRRFLIFGCFRSYELGLQTIKDMFMCSHSLGSKLFLTMLLELKDLFDNQTELDLRWASIIVLDDCIKFL